MRWLKQSTSVDVPVGPFLDSTDAITAESALTITQPDVRLKKNGGAWAQKAAAQTLAHEENGYYEVTLDATDTNTLGLLRLAIHESGALPVWEDFMVVPANIWDSLFGADLLQVDVTQLLGTAWLTPAVAGTPDVNTKIVTTGAITAAAIANGAIDAATFAAGAIDAASIAADAGTEIGTAVWATAARTLTAATNITSTGGTTFTQTGDSFLRIGATGSSLTSLASQTSLDTLDNLVDTEVGTIITDIAAVKVDTAAILVDTGTTLDAALAVVDSNVDAILVDTAEIGAAGAGLTAINLPDQTMNITGNLSGTVGSVTGAVGSVTGNVGGNVTGTVGSVVGAVGSVTGLTAANLDAAITTRATPAQVNTEVVDALATDTYAEPGQGAPGATISLAAKINHLFKAFRNQFTQTATEYNLYNDAATVVDAKAPVSDDATTFTRGKIVTGP